MRFVLILGLTATAAFAAELKNPSRFQLPEGSRNPFLPFGFQQKGGAAAPALATVKASDFVVTSIFLGAAPRMALINGKDYAEGDTILVGNGAQKTKVQLVTIFDGGVVLQYGSERITVPLRRL